MASGPMYLRIRKIITMDGRISRIAKTAPIWIAEESRMMPYMATGIVWIRPIPTSMVPCASSMDPRKVYSVATEMPGMAIGSVTLKKVRMGPAPTSRAASSCCLCTERKALAGSQTMNIMELIMWMITTPGYVPISPYL